MLRQSSQRHGNCMNCELRQNSPEQRVTGNIITLQAMAHGTSAVQSPRLDVRHDFSRPRRGQRQNNLQHCHPRNDAVERIVVGVGCVDE